MHIRLNIYPREYTVIVIITINNNPSGKLTMTHDEYEIFYNALFSDESIDVTAELIE